MGTSTNCRRTVNAAWEAHHLDESQQTRIGGCFIYSSRHVIMCAGNVVARRGAGGVRGLACIIAIFAMITDVKAEQGGNGAWAGCKMVEPRTASAKAYSRDRSNI